MPRRLLILVLFLAVAAAIAGAAGGATRAQDGTPAVSPSAGVTREVLGAGEPAAAPGQALELVRYTIPAGFRIVPHTHPGMQVAQIVSGELTYTVIDGELPITRAATAGTPGPTETLRSGQTTVLHPGDTFVEQEGMVHFGENAGSEPVVIQVASLFAVGAPPSSAVPSATPAT